MFSFFKKKSSATTAKDRLTIAIMSDRENNSYPFMDEMKAELIEVVKKYMGVKAIDVKKEVLNGVEALSIEVELEKT
ncbi:MAG: cell division topological specificity factor MinE [Campylobacterota bacterium]|nr:cell division topological specificity factor MinE [Campylobacterota bacterium]